MPWSTTRPNGAATKAKYQTPEHRDLRAEYVKAIKAGETILCAETDCLFETRLITETDGRLPHGLNLAHADDGVTYKGASHRKCNLHDGATRARARQNTTRLAW